MELMKYKRIKNKVNLPKCDTGYDSSNPIYHSNQFPYLNLRNPFSDGTIDVNNLFGKSILQGNSPLNMSSKDFFKIEPNSQTSSKGKQIGQNVLNNIGNIATSGLDFVNSISNSFSYDKSANDMLNEAGSSNSSINGVGYQTQNYANNEALRNELNATNSANTIKNVQSGVGVGGTVGSIFGPVGGAVGAGIGAIGGLIGGLFGSSKRKREMQRRIAEANKKALLLNRDRASAANSKGMQMDWEKENAGKQGILYAYNKGKDKSVTPYGKIQTKPNSKVSVGEPVLDNLNDVNNTVGYVPKTGKPHADDNYANLSNSSVVLGSDKDWRNGLTFMQQGQPYTLALEKINKKYENRTNKNINEIRGSFANVTDKLQQQNVNKLKEPIVELLNDLADQQKYQHEIEGKNMELTGFKCGKNKYKCGKDGYKKYDIGKEGWLNNFIPNAIGAGLSMKQYYDAKGQSLNAPDIYAQNPYEQRALNELAGLQISGYPILRQLRDAEVRQNYALDRSGGLTGAQKYLGRIANANNLYSNIADMWSNLQEKNNQYKTQYATSMLNAGNSDAQRRQAANQYREEAYAKAHGARQQQMQMGMRNFMDYLNQYSANEFKRRQFNDMLSLYQADMGLTTGKKSKNKNSKINTTTNANNPINFNIGDIPSKYYAKIDQPKETLSRGIPQNITRISDNMVPKYNSEKMSSIVPEIAMPTRDRILNARHNIVNPDIISTYRPNFFDVNNPEVGAMNVPKQTYFRNGRYSGNVDEMPSRAINDNMSINNIESNIPQRMNYMDINDLSQYGIPFTIKNERLNTNLNHRRRGMLDYFDFMRTLPILNSGRMKVLPN